MSLHVVKKRKQTSAADRRSVQDSLYFDSYQDVTIHEEMIADHARTSTYRTAILRNEASIRGKVVLDVGAGTGVLSVFCVQAGARKVYAVEACSIAEQAVKIVRQNGMEDRIEVIRGTLESIELPEMVDVIVSEWMGYALLHESMLNSVLHGRDRWLKPGGLILPSKAELYIAPINDLVVEDRLNFWHTVKDQYGVDMSCMADFAQRCIMNNEVTVTPVTVEDVLSHPSRFAELDLRTVTPAELTCVRGAFQCDCFGSAAVNALCVWFTVTFPIVGPAGASLSLSLSSPMAPLGSEDGGGGGGGNGNNKPLVLSTSPFMPETHWKQAVLYLDGPVEVVQDTKVVGEVTMRPSEDSARHITIRVDYAIGERKLESKSFSIPDGYSSSSSSSSATTATATAEPQQQQ